MRHALLTGAALAALITAPAFAKGAPETPAPATAASADQPSDTPSADDQNKNEIVVTGSPLAVETPTITTKVNRDQIVQTGGANLADALANVPGIASTGFATGASRPIIRGMDATRVRVLEDGSSSSDVSDIGPDHGVPIDPLAAQSIEVVRGPSTLRYGSQAIGGVVNVLNNRVPTALPARSFGGEATGTYATNADIWQGSLLADAKVGDFALHADGFYRHTGDYDTPLGTETNSFFHGYGGSLGGSYFFGPDKGSHIGVAVQQYDAQYGIPNDTVYIDMRQTKVMARSLFDLGSGPIQSLRIDGSYADYRHDEDNPDGSINSTFLNKEVDSHAELLFGKLGFVGSSALGVEVQHRDFSAIGEDSSYLFPTTTQSEAAYLFTDVPLGDAFKIQASGRVESVHVEGTPASDVFTSRNFTPVSGAIGALLTLGPVKLGATFSSTGRAPGVTELFARGAHDGPGTFETGDPTLKIERANSLEGTLRLNSGRLHFEGSVYGTWFHNYVYGDLTGSTCDEDGNCVPDDSEEFKQLDYRQQGAKFWGLEGEADFDLIKGDRSKLNARVLADYVRATLDDGSNVPRIPPYRFGGGLNWTSERFDAGFLFLRAGRQDKFGALGTPTPGYDSLNANIAVRPFSDHPGIEFAIVGQNLTNDLQRNAASLNKDDVPLSGRTVRFVVRLATF